MVQAARSGVANIIEGSEASAASKKTELKLTSVARASQEELAADYLAFLRQRSLPIWKSNSESAKTVRSAKPENLFQLRQLMAALVSDLSDSSDKNRLKTGNRSKHNNLPNQTGNFSIRPPNFTPCNCL